MDERKLPALRSWYQSSDRRRRLYAVSLNSSGCGATCRSEASGVVANRDSCRRMTPYPAVDGSIAAAAAAPGTADIELRGGAWGDGLPCSQVSRNRDAMSWCAALMLSISRR